MPTGTSELLSIQVILLLLVNSSTNKEHPKTKQNTQKTSKTQKKQKKKSYILMASQIYWGKKNTPPPPDRDAQEPITELWYELNPQDGAISAPSVLHLRPLTAVPVRRKPKEHASTDILIRQQNSLRGVYSQEAITLFLPSLVSCWVPGGITHPSVCTH